MRRQLFGVVRMIGRRGAEDRHVVGSGRHRGVEIGEDAILGKSELLDRDLHLRAIRVEDRGDLGLRMLMNQGEQVAHVHVVETDADDAEFGHGRSCQRLVVKRT